MKKRQVALGALAALVLTAPAAAQEIQIRLSIKYILDASGQRGQGTFSDPNSIYQVIDDTNEMLARWDRGYEFVVVEAVDVWGGSQFFDIADNAEFDLLETTAEADPSTYKWRTWATNIYMVDSMFTGGAAAIPSGDPNKEITVMTCNVNPFDTIWAHELGHHFDLYHTFDPTDFVNDTRADPNPNQCTTQWGCSMGGNKECCCTTKLSNLNAVAVAQAWTQAEYDDIRFNLMSYYGATDCSVPLTFDNLRLSEGQHDRWADATRRYHSGEVSGLTYFIDKNATTAPFDGYSTSPIPAIWWGEAVADPNGGDILMIRAGTYNEALTITDPVTLRAWGGSVLIEP